MDTTVSVALITSLSTLTAGAIASATTLMINRSQANKENKRLQTERKERYADQKREIRRDAYLQLLGKFDEVDNLMNECWKLYPQGEDAPVRQEMLEAGESINALDYALNVVRLEGPQKVVDAAQEMQLLFNGEIVDMLRLSTSNPNAQKPLYLLEENDGNPYGKALGGRRNKKEKFIITARQALEDT
jgi:hypothetical protein